MACHIILTEALLLKISCLRESYESDAYASKLVIIRMMSARHDGSREITLVMLTEGTDGCCRTCRGQQALCLAHKGPRVIAADGQCSTEAG